MADPTLSQAEADALIVMEKIREDEKEYDFPSPGEKLVVPLTSKDRREKFLLDVTRVRIDLTKVTYQSRARQVIVLVRLDIGGARHLNPDLTEVPCPHIHLYREGFGDKWAEPAPPNLFTDTKDIYKTLLEFMTRCNITETPVIRKVLF